MLPMQYPIYKGTGGRFGALQLTPQPPHHYKDKEKSFNEKDRNGESIFEFTEGRRRLKEGWKEREGCLFLNITSSKDKNVYDWENKIVMALSVTDMSHILYFLTTGKSTKGENGLRLMHDPGAKSSNQGAVKKYLTFYSPDGTAKGTMITAKQQSGGSEIEHKVPMDGAEVIALRTLLQAAMPKALCW